VGWSNNAAGAQGHHGLTAFSLDRANGALTPHCQPLARRARPVFLAVDAAGQHVIVAYNLPSSASVHRIQPDGTLGEEVSQPPGLDFGIYANQVRAHPSGQMVVIPTRGNVAANGKPEDPGALKIYGYRGGVLSNRLSVAPNGGRGFSPRHVDFHPGSPFLFATIEAQNELHVYRVMNGPSLGPAPLFSRKTLANPARGDAGQATSAIHVHPNSRFVDLGNRGPAAGGENSIAVFAINRKTGEPKLIQSADTAGVHPRTFTIDPGGTMLVVANLQRAGDEPPLLSVFRIGADGKLSFAQKYPLDRGNTRGLFWTGMMALPR